MENKRKKADMNPIVFVDLEDLDQKRLLEILNKDRVREHLVSHDEFDAASLNEWLQGKREVDQEPGCRVRGILCGGSVAGWCGIQFENEAYELAIVLDEAYWGIGLRVFKEMMVWAEEMDHDHVVLHLFNTRREYQFLKKMASRVFESELFGQRYTSYELPVKPKS